MRHSWVKEFADKKICIARNLYEGKCEGTYAEAIIILASVISGIASRVWPGKNIDRKRFVELCVHYADAGLGTAKISIPLLIEHLHEEGNHKEVSVIKHKFPKEFLMFPNTDTLKITGDRIDLFESEVLQLGLSIESKELREFSYANLFYTEVRSGMVHEYRSGERASSMPMFDEDGFVSYVNMMGRRTNRLIHFSYNWIERVVMSISDYIYEHTSESPYNHPDKWWLDG